MRVKIAGPYALRGKEKKELIDFLFQVFKKKPFEHGFLIGYKRSNVFFTRFIDKAEDGGFDLKNAKVPKKGQCLLKQFLLSHDLDF